MLVCHYVEIYTFENSTIKKPSLSVCSFFARERETRLSLLVIAADSASRGIPIAADTGLIDWIS